MVALPLAKGSLVMWDIPWEPLSIPLLKKNRTQKLFGKGEKIKIQSHTRKKRIKTINWEEGKESKPLYFCLYNEFKTKRKQIYFLPLRKERIQVQNHTCKERTKTINWRERKEPKPLCLCLYNDFKTRRAPQIPLQDH